MHVPTIDESFMILGDTHGNTKFWRSFVIPEAKKYGCKLIIQVGDFGYWEHQQNGKNYLDLLERMCEEQDCWIVWLDGNHENHPLLWHKYKDAPRTEEGFWEIRKRIFYIPRGLSWTWNGVKFLAMGGGYSIDKEWRLKEMQDYEIMAMHEIDTTVPREMRHYASHWDTELITDENVQEALKAGQVDVVLSHDCPTSASIETQMVVAGRSYWKGQPETMANASKLEEILFHCKPRRWYHGHMHLGYTFYANVHMSGFPTCRIQGLSWDGDLERQFTVVSLEELGSEL